MTGCDGGSVFGIAGKITRLMADRMSRVWADLLYELSAHFAEPALYLHLVVWRLCDNYNPQSVQHTLLHLQWQNMRGSRQWEIQQPPWRK